MFHCLYSIVMGEIATGSEKIPVLDIEIRVRGHIDADWSNRFSGLAINHTEEGDTILSGPIRDQPELRGLLSWLADLGFELVSVATEAACGPIPSESDLETRRKRATKTKAKGGKP